MFVRHICAYLTIIHLGEYSLILTSPEATNCCSIITLMIIQENKFFDQNSDSETSTNLAAILKTAGLQCYNHRAVIIVG